MTKKFKKPKKSKKPIRRTDGRDIIYAEDLVGKISVPRVKYEWINDGSGNGWWMNTNDGSLSYCYSR